ncbi:MAG: hypothetical protein JSV97_03595 [candidate division WOR-3 bacterium]|nr:MAG: hypothetical protein JSV97_03595 [candidate division WOR-3 bacterium]
MLLFIILSYTLPLDSPIMYHIEYLQLRGLIDIPSVRPYELDWIVPQIDDILISEVTLNEVDKKILSFFHPLLIKDPDFSYLVHVNGEYQTNPELYYGLLDERFGGTLTNSITYAHGMSIRRANELDSLGPRPWKDFQAYLHEGLIRFNINKIQFNIGRRNYLLGFADENSLLLSPDKQGYDGFYLFMPSRYYEFYTIFTILDAQKNRYLSVHRIGLDLKRFLKLGFSEAILFTGSLQPIYLNFLLPYYLAQWGTDRNDNIMWSFDIQINLFNSLMYAEFLIDDYMYEDDPYPDKLAFSLGLKSLLFAKFLVKLNYTAVDKWVYTHERRVNTYERNGSPLGFPLGNDVDQLNFSCVFMNEYGLYPRFTLQYTRKGEGSISVPYEQEGGSWTPPFPSGIVEKKLDITLGLQCVLRYKFYIGIDVGQRYWKNYDHISGDDRDEMLFTISMKMII